MARAQCTGKRYVRMAVISAEMSFVELLIFPLIACCVFNDFDLDAS